MASNAARPERWRGPLRAVGRHELHPSNDPASSVAQRLLDDHLATFDAGGSSSVAEWLVYDHAATFDGGEVQRVPVARTVVESIL